MSVSFGDLRSLLQQTQTPHNFIRICKVLSSVSVEQYASDYQAYVLEHLSHWPDASRVVPPQWLHRWREWSEDPRMEMCRSMMCVGSQSVEDVLMKRPGWMTHLTVRQQSVNGPDKFHRLPSLTHLTLQNVTFQYRLDIYDWPALKHIHFERCKLQRAPIIESTTLETLVCLQQEPPLHQWSMPYVANFKGITISEEHYRAGQGFYDDWAELGVEITRVAL